MLTRRTLLTAAGAAAAPQAFAQTPRRILFIGNSLTYYNNLPQLAEAVFAGAGEPIETRMVAKPDFSLTDHWRDGDALEAIASGPWDIVVLQQGVSARGDSRRQLRREAARYAPLIAQAGARPAMYAVWPPRERIHDSARAAESYALAAADIGAMLFPVTDAWLAARRLSREVDLYSPDGRHPSAYGTYLAVLVMYAVITQRSPVGLPRVLALDDGRLARVPEEFAAPLEQAAAEATDQQ